MSSSIRRPDSNRVGAWPTATCASRTRAPIAARIFRSSACDQTAPKAPVLAPTTATGLFRSTFVATGRDAQSSAFLSWPGTDELYSGVANRTASAPAIAARRRVTASGAGSTSSSSSYGGTAFRPSHSSSSTSGWSSSCAARRRFVLWESRRRLPEIARTFMACLLGRLHELDVGDDGDLVPEGRLAGRERHVPVQAECRAV